MEWIGSISEALRYIEDNITQDISIADIAKRVSISPYYLQRIFSMLCGYTISEYIRNRRLTLAGNELTLHGVKVIDVALKYGYESPDSFTKAFTRFHGVTPSAVQKGNAVIKSFLPLKIKVSLEGGNIMDYRIVKKESFSVIGVSKKLTYEGASETVPRMWAEHYVTGSTKYVHGMFGISCDVEMTGEEFEYTIADVYFPQADIPAGFTVKQIPAFTWAVFPCTGPSRTALVQLNKRIGTEFLPSIQEYEIAAGYWLEVYDDVSKYPKGIQDENYHSEIWIPVKKK